MNRFMRAVGFSKYKTNRELDKMFEDACSRQDTYDTFPDGEKGEYFEITQMTGDGFGLVWCGHMEDKTPMYEYCYPIVKGEEYFSEQYINVEEKSVGNIYSGAFEDLRAGVFIVFFLQNGIECRRGQDLRECEMDRRDLALSGLALSGTILLPLALSEESSQKRVREQKKRIKLLSAAKQGDEKAMESLACQEMDTYTKVSKRILTEDVFSIVESSFMPYGMECDQYSIVADIVGVKEAKNTYTKEGVWKLKLNYNGILLDLCLNKKDLTGEPREGRRFKGNIWLQGRI